MSFAAVLKKNLNHRRAIMASKEANKAKYQYNKKYVERYWEKRAQSENGTVTTESEKTVTVKETELFGWLLPDLTVTEVTVSRNGQDDKQYIKALETANKTINSENARLLRLLRKYQDIIRAGLKQIMFDIEKCK